MKRVLKILAIIVVSLFLLSIFGWMSHHVTKGDRGYGAFNRVVRAMYQFPDLVGQSAEEVKSLPGTYVRTYGKFKTINQLDFDLNVLVTYSESAKTRIIDLMNLRNDSVLYRWKVDNPYNDIKRIYNPLLFPDKQLVYSFNRSPLYRIDSLSNILWVQDSVWSHHSLTLDADGNVWACTENPTYEPTALFSIDNKKVYYRDNSITQLDPETGKILYTKSLTDMYRENDMLNYLLKSESQIDPFHINDVQPALKSTAYYEKNDLFLSLRQSSLIIQFRPSTNEVIRTIEGPFANQHDVDFMGDSSIIFFNNNYYTKARHASMTKAEDSGPLTQGKDLSSHIVRYHFEDDSYSFIGDSIFRANDIFSRTESLQEFIGPDTYFVEEQNPSLLWVIRGDEVIYKNVLKSQHEGYHHLANWTRIVTDY